MVCAEFAVDTFAEAPLGLWLVWCSLALVNDSTGPSSPRGGVIGKCRVRRRVLGRQVMVCVVSRHALFLEMTQNESGGSSAGPHSRRRWRPGVGYTFGAEVSESGPIHRTNGTAHVRRTCVIIRGGARRYCPLGCPDAVTRRGLVVAGLMLVSTLTWCCRAVAKASSEQASLG